MMATARKITDKQIARVRSLLAMGQQQNEVCRTTGVGQNTVSLIARDVGRYSKKAVAEREAESRCLYANGQCSRPGWPIVGGLCVYHAAIEAARRGRT